MAKLDEVLVREALVIIGVSLMVLGPLSAATGYNAAMAGTFHDLERFCEGVYPPDDRPEQHGPSQNGEWSWFPLGVECMFHDTAFEQNGSIFKGSIVPTYLFYGGLAGSAIGAMMVFAGRQLKRTAPDWDAPRVTHSYLSGG